MEQMKDISARLKAVRGDKTQTAEGDGAKSYNYEESYRLRARMVGVLLRDARVAAMRTVDDCARLVRVDAATVEAWEYGDAIPSLPQLELLAFYLDVPVSHFWGLETLEANRRTPVDAQEEYLNLRNRMIGALLRAAREESNLTLDAVAETTHLSAEYLQAYEFGELPIPMHELSVIAGAVNKNVNYFLESSSQIGELLATRENWKHFNDLPDDLRAFAANPLNIGFIEIALAFSEMPSEKLKRIAVSMLDITGY
jgi:transcriptional regulator with XRE-family HTH domain